MTSKLTPFAWLARWSPVEGATGVIAPAGCSPATAPAGVGLLGVVVGVAGAAVGVAGGVAGVVGVATGVTGVATGVAWKVVGPVPEQFGHGAVVERVSFVKVTSAGSERPGWIPVRLEPPTAVYPGAPGTDRSSATT